MTDLRECPFCGGGAEIEQVGTRRQSQIIACTNCGCRLESAETRIDAHIQWNRRAETERETVAQWMIDNSFATGHGDSIAGLLAELKWQIEELRAKVNRIHPVPVRDAEILARARKILAEPAPELDALGKMEGKHE